jgi:hypothetical protein
MLRSGNTSSSTDVLPFAKQYKGFGGEDFYAF